MERKQMLKAALLCFAICFIVLTCFIHLQGQRAEDLATMLSGEFTLHLQESLETKGTMGFVRMDAKGTIEFWMIKKQEFTVRDFGAGIAWVGHFAERAHEFGIENLRDARLYFKREKDRFSLGEISAIECRLIIMEAQVKQMDAVSLEALILESIRWTSKKR